MDKEQILRRLPYTSPFLFVDSLMHIDINSVVGKYTFRDDLPFYKGHFKGFPLTPGALLTECCAQIGVVCLGIFLFREEVASKAAIALTKTEMEFLLPVFPGETVTVTSEKVYFRFQKLKCRVKMTNALDQLVCRGEISGMLKPSEHEK